MFKFLVLSALIAVAVAAPHVQEVPFDVVAVEAAVPEYAHIGSIVSHVPSAVSHQSRTDYHSTPVVKSVLAPFEYVQPTVHHQVPIVHQAPIVHHQAPVIHESPVVYSIASPAVQTHQVYEHSSPLVYSSVQSSPQLILSSPQYYHANQAVSSW